MKSQSISIVFDYRAQIIDNCAFISSQDDTISLTTVKEPSGDWKAIALRWNDEERDALLSSEPCDSIQKALESLHAKSAEATAVYIKTNGYKHLPISNKDDDLSEDDTASVASERSAATSAAISTWESSDEELITPASSSSTAGHASTKSSKNSKKSRKRSKAHQAHKYESETSEDELADNTPIPQITASPVRYSGNRPTSCRPIPPPGWTGPSPPPPPPPAYRGPGIMAGGRPSPPLCNPGPSGPPVQVGHLPPPPPPPPPPGFRPLYPRQTPRLYDVRITINWLHHSEQRIFESTKASIRALQDTTLAYVRSHMTAFHNVTPLDHSPNKAWTLRANIRQAVFGNEAYDISGYRGDDLTKLFNVLGKNDIPRFEIEVDYARPPGMIPHVVQVNTPPKQ